MLFRSHWLQLAIAHTRGGARPHHLVALSNCYMQSGAHGAIRVMLKESKNAALLGDALPYVEANAWAKSEADAQRMDALNELFASSGLLGIARRDERQGWSLGNLASAGAVRTCTLEMPLLSVIVTAYHAGSGPHIALDRLSRQRSKHRATR